uniref:Uncharacterized protein n=1 Tax=Alexandrium andersonii TaxID=327968 RepID=A0A7S2CHX6_9DINO|mmetsp:Transcript_38861/g.88373  ORF Transcript_38861/g.88373 Transcript_38861/m.88373 type:complete len:183 (+) Transcript_38861:83-631(+)
MADYHTYTDTDTDTDKLTDEDRSWLSPKIDAAAFVVGALSGAVLNTVWMFLFPTEHMRYLFGSGLVVSAVGSEYFGLALGSGSFKAFLLEFNMFLAVPLLVIVGLAFETPLVAAVWLLHPLYDLLHHPAYLVGLSDKIGAVKVHPKMAFYPCWCAGIDVVQGLWILYHFNPEKLSFNLVNST